MLFCFLGRRFAELELKLILFQVTIIIMHRLWPCSHNEFHVHAKQMAREFVLATDRETMEVEYAAVVRPLGDVPLYLKDRRNY